jgi:hypothetical protein
VSFGPHHYSDAYTFPYRVLSARVSIRVSVLARSSSSCRGDERVLSICMSIYRFISLLAVRASSVSGNHRARGLTSQQISMQSASHTWKVKDTPTSIRAVFNARSVFIASRNGCCSPSKDKVEWPKKMPVSTFS